MVRFFKAWMWRADCLALLISLLGGMAAYLVTVRVYEAMPHMEDEIAYVWQANVLADGHLYTSTPPFHQEFLVPFVVDYQGRRFGKYPAGWPLLLALGIRLGLRSWVNPFLAGLGVWLTYRLGKQTLGERVGLLAAGLTVLSPFFLVNSGALLSHPLGLALTAGFALTWFNAFGDLHRPPGWLPTLSAAVLFGALVITRPFTAAAIVPPFALHGLYLLFFAGRRSGSNPAALPEAGIPRSTLRLHLLVFGLLALAISSLHLVWQYVLTGNPLLNLYPLWWDYDTIGFGPGHGFAPAGHTLHQAWVNTRYSLQVGWQDLFGWGNTSWLFLPFGAWAVRRNFKALILGSLYPILVIAYLAYWVGAAVYGPRYFYEGLFSLTLLSAAGIAWLAGWPLKGTEAHLGLSAWLGERVSHTRIAGLHPRGRFRRLVELACLAFERMVSVRVVLMAALVGGLVAYNLAFFMPARLEKMHGLYEMQRSDLDPFLRPEAQRLTPALVIVHSKIWMHYGVLLELEDPYLTTPFIFALSIGPESDAALKAAFPDRRVFHYYPDQPYVFYETR